MAGGLWASVQDVVFFRNPMSEQLIYVGFALAILGSVAALGALKHAPGRFGASMAAYAARVTPATPYVLLMGGITVVVSLENLIEPHITAWLGWDFTPWVYALEGNIVERFQDTLHNGTAGPVLDVVLLLSYTWGGFLLSVLPFFILVFTGRVQSARRFSFTMVAVWAVGIVCYLFVPVYEVWVTSAPPYEYGNVQNLLLADAHALAESSLYLVNLNNNLPSLHTAVAAATVWALYYAGEKWLFRISAPIAAGVVVATMYLGIHWVIDVITGLALAWGAAWYVARREDRAGSPKARPLAAAAVTEVAQDRQP